MSHFELKVLFPVGIVASANGDRRVIVYNPGSDVLLFCHLERHS